jgi:hypothetical protein
LPGGGLSTRERLGRRREPRSQRGTGTPGRGSQSSVFFLFFYFKCRSLSTPRREGEDVRRRAVCTRSRVDLRRWGPWRLTWHRRPASCGPPSRCGPISRRGPPRRGAPTCRGRVPIDPVRFTLLVVSFFFFGSFHIPHERTWHTLFRAATRREARRA